MQKGDMPKRIPKACFWCINCFFNTIFNNYCVTQKYHSVLMQKFFLTREVLHSSFKAERQINFIVDAQIKQCNTILLKYPSQNNLVLIVSTISN